ncbi:pheromone receptor transcription activator-like [Triticum dicoccoides]|uniref:pheromone receptor transcription activator-like n=1 Tax=Triticum dicoccoides TaxID=85692 RepID=UPI001891CF72|nr:pheromone receptor transcription activator-like [Triticum dicoccoides]
MPRREKREGICFIGDKRERGITFSKRRDGLYKMACDLSVLTGVRVAVVLEMESGIMHSFGTPSAAPIVEAFLSGGPLVEPLADEATNARIRMLQGEVARLDMESVTHEKRAELSLEHIKNIQDENPGIVPNFIFSKEEDLSLEDLNKLFNELLRVREDIRRRMPPLHPISEPKTGGPNVPTNELMLRGPSCDYLNTHLSSQQPSSSHCIPPQVLSSVPLPSKPQDTMEPHFPMQISLQSAPPPLAPRLTSHLQPIVHQVPQIFQSAPPSLGSHLTSLVQPIPDPVQDLPPHLQNYPSSYNSMEPPQNNTITNSTIGSIVEGPPQLFYPNGNDFSAGESFSNGTLAYTPSNQPHYNGNLGMDAYLGHNGNNVGQYNMDYDEFVNAPPNSSNGNDGYVHSWFEGLL